MKIQCPKLNFSKLLMLFIVSTVFISCGTYQQATIEDGIYSDEIDTNRKKKVLVVNENAYADYNADYFAEELDLVDEINREDIFLEEDEYNTIDGANVATEAEKTLTYTPNQSWGSGENNDVVININFRQDPFWMGDVWAFNPYRFNYWSFNRRRFNNWWWRNNYFYGNGWNNYYVPYRWRRSNINGRRGTVSPRTRSTRVIRTRPTRTRTIPNDVRPTKTPIPNNVRTIRTPIRRSDVRPPMRTVTPPINNTPNNIRPVRTNTRTTTQPRRSKPTNIKKDNLK